MEDAIRKYEIVNTGKKQLIMLYVLIMNILSIYTIV